MNELTPIPKSADAYDSLDFVNTKCACVYKKVGYTPLQVVKSFSSFLLPEEIVKATYVGRLDPIAEGWMHVLWSGNMEEKAKLASSDKIYEIEVLFGISTDTGDMLGLVTSHNAPALDVKDIEKSIASFVGPFEYPYPAYSSPNIKQTLKSEVKEEVKKQKGNIHKIELIDSLYIEKRNLEKDIEHTLSLCKMDGDFRLDAIKEGWKSFFEKEAGDKYLKLRLRVTCSAGTYMRTLAEELGRVHDSSAFASSIKRIGILHCTS